MGLRIIYGKSGSGKSKYCFQEIKNNIDKEKKIYMITPEQFSFTAEKKLIETLNNKAVINAEVVTISRLAYRIINEIGNKNKTNLTKSGKAMIIYSILDKYKKQLRFLGKTEENIDLAMRTITELKKHGITINDLTKEKEKTTDNFLKYKLEDITLIYKNFENQINDKYIEDTDLLTILKENLDKMQDIKESVIYLDEFAGFTRTRI